MKRLCLFLCLMFSVNVFSSQNVSSNEQLLASAALPADAIKPVIKNIEIKGEKVLVTVEATSNKAYYALKATDDFTNTNSYKSGGIPVRGGLTRIVLQYPITNNNKKLFFKVFGGTLQEVTK